jgi:hypothetical protein
VTSAPTIVRQRFTPYWHADGACVTPGPEGWTKVAPNRRGAVHVRARFSLGSGDANGCGAALAAPGRRVSSR